MTALRVTFLSENIGGHATMHRGIRSALTSMAEISPYFIDLPERGPLRRVASSRVPVLGRFDLDAQALRAQLAASVLARRRIRASRTAYDVLHVYTQHAALTMPEILRGAPSVVTTDATGQQIARLLPYRDPTRFTPLLDPVRRRLERRAFDAATTVVAKSEWAAQSLVADYQVPEEKIETIPLGVTVPAAGRRDEGPGPPILTFVGSSLRRKGGLRLLRVFRSALRGDCELHIVTRDDVAEEPGVFVHRLDSTSPRFEDLLRHTAVFVLPTEMDTFGYANLEAMALGVPVVSTRVAAIPEIVEDGVTGLLVDPDDAELARALRRLLGDRALRRRMGLAGRARVLERFDARRTTARLVHVLEDAAQRWSPGSSVADRRRGATRVATTFGAARG